MRKVRPLVLGAILLQVAAPAMAQIASVGPVIMQRGGSLDERVAALSLQHVGRCLVSKTPSIATTLLASPPGSRDEEDRVYALHQRIGLCVRVSQGSVRYLPATLRGVVAEAAYLRRFPEPATDAKLFLSASVPGDWEARDRRPRENALLTVHAMASCVVERAPMTVDALLRTEPESPAEDAATRQLSRLLGPCLTAGVTFNGDRRALRAVLAEGLLRAANRAAGAEPMVASR